MATQIATLRNNVSTVQPARTIFDLLEAPRTRQGFAAVAGKYMTPERFLRFAINAVHKTPLLLKCDPKTVLGALMTSAALELEPNTIQQQAFLVPYKKRVLVDGKWRDSYECQFQTGYRGFVTLSHRSPYIKSIEAEAIHEHDLFEHMKGSDAFLKFQKTLKARGALLGAYCLTKLESGIELATVLPVDELYKIRGKSETYNSLVARVGEATSDSDRAKAERRLAETPWVMWEDDMAAKSAIKKHAKQLPLTPGDTVSTAAEIDSLADVGTIDMAAMADPDVARGVVHDGYDPPALQDNASEAASYNFPADDREREPVRQDAQQVGQAQQEDAANQGDIPTVESVIAAMRAADSLEVLEMAADTGRDITDPEQRATLDDIYSQRHAALSRGERAAPDSQRQPRRRGPINAE